MLFRPFSYGYGILIIKIENRNKNMYFIFYSFIFWQKKLSGFIIQSTYVETADIKNVSRLKVMMFLSARFIIVSRNLVTYTNNDVSLK